MFTWFLYVVPSIIQYTWILSTFVEDIEPSSFFGPRFFKIILCFPPGVFLLLDTIEYALKPELNVEWWRVFDLFDTVELLQILLADINTSLSINQTTKTFMLILASSSLLFPAFSLWELQPCRNIPSEGEASGSNNSSGNERTCLKVSRVRIISKVCQLVLVNLAFLAIRLVLFFDFNLDASVFVAKNVIALAVGIIEIISACRRKRTKGRSQENKSLRLSQITATSSSSRIIALDSPNDQQKPIKQEELTVSSRDLSRRDPSLYRDPEKLSTYPCSSILNDISLDGHISETSLRFPSQIGATFTKMIESRSTQTEIESDQLYCQLCGLQKIRRLAAVERFQNSIGYTEYVSGDSKVCSSRDTLVLESDQLCSAFQKITRQEQRFLKQNHPRKSQSPHVTEAKESRSREQEYSEPQTLLRESTVSLNPCGDSKMALSSDRRIKESVKPLLNLGSNRRLSMEHDARIEELNHLFPRRLPSTAKQEESFSEKKNSRREQLVTLNPRVQLPFNTGSVELNQNVYRSPSLDSIRDDKDTGEIHLAFTGLDNGPKRSTERPKKESAIRQYKRHQRNRRDTCALESDQLRSAFQKTTRQEQRFPKQKHPRKFQSPHVTEAKESKSRSLALHQKKTREQGYSETQTPLGENTVSLDPCGDYHHFPSMLQSTTKQEESFSERRHFRREKSVSINPRVPLSFNTRSEELNSYRSPSLDHIGADYDTNINMINNGPKRSSVRPDTESAIRQHKKHQRNRRGEHNMHSPAFTIWNTRN